MAFTLVGRWVAHNRRLVTVTWDDGKLSGDPELTVSLRALDGSGEVVGFDDGNHELVADLSSPSLALETISYWMGEVLAIDGEIPPDVSVGDYLDRTWVQDELEQALARWFGSVALGTDIALSTAGVLWELVSMLDVLQPPLIDRSGSSVRAEGHGWLLDDAVVAQITHAADSDAMVSVAVGTDEAIVSWLTVHEHVGPGLSIPTGRFARMVVDTVAKVLRGHYEVEHHFRGRRLVKSRIIDVSDPCRPQVVSITGSLVLSWLPWHGSKRVERRRLTFGVAPPNWS